MAKKLTKEMEQQKAHDGLKLLKTTATKDVSFEFEGKEYTVAGAKITAGIAKSLTFKDEGEFMAVFQKLWDRQVAKVEGLEAILDEIDWEEWDNLFLDWFSPIEAAYEELEKKYA